MFTNLKERSLCSFIQVNHLELFSIAAYWNGGLMSKKLKNKLWRESLPCLSF